MSHVPFPTCPHVNKDNDKQSQWEHMLGDVIIMGALTHEVIHMVSMLPPNFFKFFLKFFKKNLFLQIQIPSLIIIQWIVVGWLF